MSQFSLSFFPAQKIYSITEINAAIRDTLEKSFADVWVAGEISNCRAAPSGHLYFTLKDAQSQLKCVFFRQNNRYLKFQPADGLAVVARGRLSVYEVRGEYQLYIEHLEPRGAGALQLAFEQLKKKLAAEGLFDPARKRPLPLAPRRIGLVTSPRGAVIADLVRILGRRFPGLAVRLYPVRVQGEGAAEEIAKAIEYFSQSGWPEVVIAGRGGGSLEDLWPFNEERVARAIAASAVPVISAVGHETDFTIADFAADLRAPTPSAAAELAVRTRQEMEAMVAALVERLSHGAQYRIAVLGRRWREHGMEAALAVLRRRLHHGSQRTDELDFRLQQQARKRLLEAERRYNTTAAELREKDPRRQLAARRERLAKLEANCERLAHLRLARLRGRLDSLHAQLGHLSPLSVLERGYAIVQDEAGRILRKTSETAPGREIRVRLHEGRLGAEVKTVEGPGEARRVPIEGEKPEAGRRPKDAGRR